MREGKRERARERENSYICSINSYSRYIWWMTTPTAESCKIEVTDSNLTRLLRSKAIRRKKLVSIENEVLEEETLKTGREKHSEASGRS